MVAGLEPPPPPPPRAGSAVTAWPHEGIVPIELWDVLVDGATLFARRDEADFYESLVAAVRALRSGDAMRETAGRLPARAWDAVALVGGALDETRARDAFDAAGIALDVIAADPFFAASHALEALKEGRERGGLQARGDDDGVVVLDVGQSAVKAWGPSGRVHRLRSAAPIEGAPGPGAPDRRAWFVDGIARVIEEACGGREPSFALLGLPCEVEARGDAVRLGPSTYPTEGDGASLAREVLARAGFPSTPVALVNDAILAAWALARRSPCAVRSRLVLTIGFGVGAALIAPESRTA